MPDIQDLIRYIDERRIKEEDGSGYSFVAELPPTIRDTFFALACLKMLKVDSPDEEIVRFLKRQDSFDFNDAYYAMMCLKLAGAKVECQSGKLRWIYRGDEQQRPCFIPSTPLIRYFKYEMYGRYGSSIFSSSLGSVLKRIELSQNSIGNGLVNSTLGLLNTGNQDIMRTYMALEILKAIEKRGYSIPKSSSHINNISDFLKRCTTRKGYVASPNASSITLDSTYAGHRIAQYINIPDPLGIVSFMDSLQNDNGGFRRSPFGGISTLESCYLVMSILFEEPGEEL